MNIKTLYFFSKISYWIAHDDGIAQNCWPLYLPLPCVYDLWHLIQFSFANSFSARLALRKIMHLIDSHLRFTIWRPPDHPFPMKYDDYLFSTGAKHSLQPISFFLKDVFSSEQQSQECSLKQLYSLEANLLLFFKAINHKTFSKAFIGLTCSSCKANYWVPNKQSFILLNITENKFLGNYFCRS